MGLIALVGLALAGAGLILCGCLSYFFLRLVIANRIIHLALLLPVTIVLFALLWSLCNLGEIRRQGRMNDVDKDCGWTIYQSVPQVDGLYVEFDDSAKDRGVPTAISQHYDFEYQDPQGRVMHVSKNAYPGQAIGKRIFRYGMRIAKESIAPDIERVTETLLNFDTNERYARHAEYWFHYDGSSSVDTTGLMLLFVKYQASGCGEVREDEEVSRIREVFHPESDG